MTENILTTSWARVRLAFERSALAGFFAWWGRELSPLVPQRVRQWFTSQRSSLWLVLRDGALEVRHGGRADEPGQRIELGDADLARAELNRLSLGREEIPDLVLCLPAAQVLQRRMNLPAAAEENLHRVLGFEMDRQTPFRAEQLYFDHRVERRDSTTREIGVHWLAVPQAVLDAQLNQLAPLNIQLDVADALDGEGRRFGFNLLPSDRRARRPRPWLKINLAAAAVVLVLLGFVMQGSLHNREIALAALTAQTEKVHVEAKTVSELRGALSDAIEGTNFLTAKKRDRAPLIDLLRDFTERLPEDTFLQRVSTTADEVQLAGQSKEAAALVPMLQKSPFIESPALQGAVTPDPRTNKEQFTIAAKWKHLDSAAATPAEKEKSKEADSGDSAQR